MELWHYLLILRYLFHNDDFAGHVVGPEVLPSLLIWKILSGLRKIFYSLARTTTDENRKDGIILCHRYHRHNALGNENNTIIIDLIEEVPSEFSKCTICKDKMGLWQWMGPSATGEKTV